MPNFEHLNFIFDDNSGNSRLVHQFFVRYCSLGEHVCSQDVIVIVIATAPRRDFRDARLKTEPVTSPLLGRRTNNLTSPHCYLSTPHPKLIQLRQMHQKI